MNRDGMTNHRMKSTDQQALNIVDIISHMIMGVKSQAFWCELSVPALSPSFLTLFFAPSFFYRFPTPSPSNFIGSSSTPCSRSPETLCLVLSVSVRFSCHPHQYSAFSPVESLLQLLSNIFTYFLNNYL